MYTQIDFISNFYHDEYDDLVREEKKARERERGRVGKRRNIKNFSFVCFILLAKGGKKFSFFCGFFLLFYGTLPVVLSQS